MTQRKKKKNQENVLNLSVYNPFTFLSFVYNMDSEKFYKKFDDFKVVFEYFLNDDGMKKLKMMLSHKMPNTSIVDFFLEHLEYLKNASFSYQVESAEDLKNLMLILDSPVFEKLKKDRYFRKIVSNFLGDDGIRALENSQEPLDFLIMCEDDPVEVDDIKPKRYKQYSLGASANILKFLEPRKIKKYLDDYVIGQEEAKTKIAFTFYKYISGIINKNVTLQNVWLIGPSGSGKTYIMRKLHEYVQQHLSDFPFYEFDMTKYTSSGYVGRDILEILNYYSPSYPYGGIVFLDEIDKRATNPSASDVVGRMVQEELLKIIEGSHPHTYSSKLWFILAGSFGRIYELQKEAHPIGFTQQSQPEMYHKKITVNDLIKYGMIPELVRRVPNIITLNPLTKEDLVKIMKEAKDNPLQKYLTSWENVGVIINLSDDVIDLIAEKAYNLQIGASAIESVTFELLEPIGIYAMNHNISNIKIENRNDLEKLIKNYKNKNCDIISHEINDKNNDINPKDNVDI